MSRWGEFAQRFETVAVLRYSRMGTELRQSYLHTDNQGSVEALSDSSGTVISRHGHDRWGQRRDADGWGSGSASSQTAKGYTGHEMADAVGVIHMGGRVYDPVIGRFTSADPIVQTPGDLQSYNRYGYVGNNPLSRTDPSGYSWLGNALKRAEDWTRQNWRPVAAIAISVVSGGLAAGATSTWLAASYAAVGGFAAGLVTSGGDLQAGLIGAATALAFYGVGSHYQSLQQASKTRTLRAGQQFAKVLSHGAIGGASSVAQGGKFGTGALSALVPEAGRTYANLGNDVISAALLGGTASVVGGGKFANGAVTGAFGYLFNAALHPNSEMSLSKDGLDFLKQFEGYSSTIYLDTAGKATIGYGHLLVGNEAQLYANGITETQASQLLAADLAAAEAAVRAVPVSLTQSQYDALVSFTYNAGAGGLAQSRILPYLRAGDVHNAAVSFGRFVRSGTVYPRGLSFRRASEADLFLNGTY